MPKLLDCIVNNFGKVIINLEWTDDEGACVKPLGAFAALDHSAIAPSPSIKVPVCCYLFSFCDLVWLDQKHFKRLFFLQKIFLSTRTSSSSWSISVSARTRKAAWPPSSRPAAAHPPTLPRNSSPARTTSAQKLTSGKLFSQLSLHQLFDYFATNFPLNLSVKFHGRDLSLYLCA